ncbi:PREDICTED: receptor like protein 30-like [Camelina sativa]|uniref:Receptor like protein 30-like n=1 Tax=Camelina sativa TaxID=90675 RepID=A0ABM0VKH2_CAMSA|nr:PREDICTED: receptor like protein 30-like [Camelina sativa]
MPSLLELDLSQNHLREPLENLNSSSSSKLKTLYLGRNLFSGRILEPISRLVKLTYLDLSFLTILNPINIVSLPLKSLEFLDLSGNTLSRLNTTSSDHALTNLIGLYLSSCSLVEFPEILKTLPNLQELDIFNNRLQGKVPGWLWDLPLTKVSLSTNSLDGFEGSREVVLPSSLVMLDLSSNAFGGPFPILPPTIDSLIASKNNFTGDLPLSLCNPRKLTVLDLSHNSFSGPIPQCLSDLVEGIMNLRHNNLNGMLPDIFCRSGSSLITLDVSKNQITGKLPRSLANCNRLKLLNVENNMITDTFPFWLKALPLLQVIALGSNRFYGSISSPQDDPLSFSKLQIIDISRNNFNGSLPPNYFMNWSSTTSSEDHGRRQENDQYMMMNGFHGRRRNMDFLKMLTPYTAIDFSGNRLGGQIPESIGLLKSIHALNLSNNDFTGHIPSSMAKLTELVSLDLSRNQLSGNIPQELTNLSFLAILNMSYNKLTGQIPQGRQFNTFTESSFEGNINLCGPPLQKSCSGAAHDLNSKAATIDYGPTLILMLFFGLGIGHA